MQLRRRQQKKRSLGNINRPNKGTGQYLFNHFLNSHGLSNPAVIGDSDGDRRYLNYLGQAKPCKAEQIRCVGYLDIENIVRNSEDFNTGSWVKSGGASTPSANVLNYPILLADVIQTISRPISAGDKFVGVAKLSGVGKITIRIVREGGGVFEQSFFSITLTPTFKEYVVTHTFANAHTGVKFSIIRNTGDTATVVNAEYAFLQDKTAAIDPTIPDMYVSTDAGNNPNSNVDGIIYSPYLNGNSVVDNELIRAQGDLITDANSAISPKGYYGAGEKEEITGFSNDITNWLSVTSASVVRDGVGVNGLPNNSDRVIDNSAIATQYREKLTAITSSTSDYYLKTITPYIAVPTSYALIQIAAIGGTDVVSNIVFNPTDGTIVSVGDAAVFESVLIGDLWYINQKITDNGTGNTQLRTRVFPSWNDDGSVTQDASIQGDIDIKSCESYKDSPSFMPMLTTGGVTLTSPADVEATSSINWATLYDARGSIELVVTNTAKDSTGVYQGIITPRGILTSRFIYNASTADNRINRGDGASQVGLDDIFDTFFSTVRLRMSWDDKKGEIVLSGLKASGELIYTVVNTNFPGTFTPQGIVTYLRARTQGMMIKYIKLWKEPKGTNWVQEGAVDVDEFTTEFTSEFT